MRKLVVFCHLSVDGKASLPNGNLGWISYNEELAKWASLIVEETDTAMYGKNTYVLMRDYWRNVPNDPNSSEYELKHAKWIENVEKVVFSTTLEEQEWNNTKIIKDNIKEEILKLKQRSGKNISIFGSPTLVNSLFKLGVIDEFQLSINPILLGDGKFLFEGVKDKTKLNLIEEKTLESGTVTLHYEINY